ncbi:unnamed protein product [Caenorhabditis angaria]|uniref:Uncharacterized protein n=1 Tax=Caenorhabditis angaria TaxID=860376 RepID=A0A9P1J3C8_9PELO|nr:unnamed protein product [Caenorhabditis angaria]
MIVILLFIFFFTKYYIQEHIPLYVVLRESPQVHLYFVNCKNYTDEVLKSHHENQYHENAYTCWNEKTYGPFCKKQIPLLIDPVIFWIADKDDEVQTSTKLSEILTKNHDGVLVPRMTLDGVAKFGMKFRIHEVVYYHCDTLVDLKDIRPDLAEDFDDGFDLEFHSVLADYDFEDVENIEESEPMFSTEEMIERIEMFD